MRKGSDDDHNKHISSGQVSRESGDKTMRIEKAALLLIDKSI